MRIPLLPLGAIMAVSLCSCIGTVVKIVVKKTDLKYSVPPPILYSENGEFKGLRDFIATSQGQANILLTHGLTDKTEDHFDLLVERLASRLKLRMKSKRTPIVTGNITNNRDGRTLGFDAWKLFEWQFEQLETRKPVRFYFVYWAPITKPAKDFIHAYNESIHRTRLSSLTKDSLFINIFGDLALYLNTDYKLQLQQAFLKSIEHIEGPFVVVGGGFGVQLLFEAVLEELYKRDSSKFDVETAQLNNRGVTVEESRELEKAQGKDVKYQSQYVIPRVYLLTNQIPFVSLLTLKVYDRLSEDAHNEDVLAVIRNYCSAKQSPIDLVSFYDPNDPFGYVLPVMQNDPWIRLYNVRLNIAEVWRIDPVRTTQFILPQIKSQKAQDLMLSLVDQKSTTQDLMLNLKGPSNQTRNDYRVMGALAGGHEYKFVCGPQDLKEPRVRNVEIRRAESLLMLKADIADFIARRLKVKLEMKSSVLPFSLPSLFRDINGIDTIRSLTFQGIDRSIELNEITQIMTVHGVKNQEPDSFDEIVNSVAKSLGFYSRPSNIRVVCPDNEICPTHGELELAYRPGTVKITTFEGVSGQKLIIYAVYWSSVTKPAKNWLDTVSVKKLEDVSSVVPKLIKRELINDGFADIEISFGDLRVQVNSVLAKAFKEMNNDYNSVKSKRGLNTYYLTGSLGSRLLLDYLGENLSDPVLANENVLQVQARARTWFMLTNQFIMTALKDIKLNDKQSGDLDDAISYEQVFKTTYQKMLNVVEDSSPFDIVGFNDPNDLLSFILPDSVMGVGTNHRKVYNTYLNLAKGVNVNMDNLIRTVAKADRKLENRHRREYRKLLHCFKHSERKIGNRTILDTDDEYFDYYDMLKNAKKRFNSRTRRLQPFAPPTRKINPGIEQRLSDGDLDSKKLRSLFNRKKRWYSSNLYVSKRTWTTQRQAYRDLRRELNAGKKLFQRSKVITRCNFRKLSRPGLIMPFIKSIADYKHYQDFVTDFGRAHVGAKENSKVVRMISHGFESVTKTNVDQHLYNKVHNQGRARN